MLDLMGYCRMGQYLLAMRVEDYDVPPRDKRWHVCEMVDRIESDTKAPSLAGLVK